MWKGGWGGGVLIIAVMKFISYYYKMNTNNLLKEFGCQPLHEKERIISLLIDHLDLHDGLLGLVMKELESCQIKSPSCIHCGSKSTIKRARIKTIQRYSCNECGKYWMATNGTSLAGLHKRNLWQKYILAFEKGFSIRKAAQELGISIQTSFRWRHRLLASISDHLPDELSGIIETANFQLPRNTKGQRKPSNSPDDKKPEKGFQSPLNISVLFSTSRTSGESFSKVIAAEVPEVNQIRKALQGKIQTGSILITQANDAFSFFKDEELLQYLSVSKSKKRRDPVNLNKVRAHHQSFLEFLLPFNGVATKYLQNYLNWYHYKELTKTRLDKIKHSIRVCFTEDKAMEWLKNLTIKDTIIIT